MANAFKVAGSTLETHLARHLDAALAHGYDLFHLSITAPTRKDLPLITFEGWLRRLRTYKGVGCIVAAGNSGYALPTWPAAFPDVVSVGALAADWRSRASFSNHGPWVDVYAPGRDLVNAFAIGNYTLLHGPVHGPAEDVLRHGEVERDVLLDADRDRAHRCPDVAHRRKRHRKRRPRSWPRRANARSAAWARSHSPTTTIAPGRSASPLTR